jgi:hypothetical protein
MSSKKIVVKGDGKRIIIQEGSVQKGGKNTTSEIKNRPPPPKPTKNK